MPLLNLLGVSEQVISNFEISFMQGYPGCPVFHYSNGDFEHYGAGFHRFPVSAGYWVSRWTDLNIVRRVILCRSAMEAVAFLHFNELRFPKSEELLFISLGLLSAIPIELLTILKSRKLEIIIGDDPFDNIYMFSQIMLLQGKKTRFLYHNDNIQISVGSNTISVSHSKVKCIRIFKMFAIRRFFSAYQTGKKGSYLIRLTGRLENKQINRTRQVALQSK